MLADEYVPEQEDGDLPEDLKGTKLTPVSVDTSGLQGAPPEDEATPRRGPRLPVGPIAFAGSLLLALGTWLMASMAPPSELEVLRERQEKVLQQTYARWLARGGRHALPQSEAERSALAFNLLQKWTAPVDDRAGLGREGARVHPEAGDTATGPAAIRLQARRSEIEEVPGGALLAGGWLCRVELDPLGHAVWSVTSVLREDDARRAGLPLVVAWNPASFRARPPLEHSIFMLEATPGAVAGLEDHGGGGGGH